MKFTKHWKNYLALAAVVISLFELFLKYSGIDHPIWLEMQTCTALTFFFSGWAFYLLGPEKIGHKRELFGRAMALVVVSLSLIGFDSGIMTFGAALNLTFIGLALFFLQNKSSKFQIFSQLCTLAVILISFSGLFTDLFGVKELDPLFSPVELVFPKVRILLFLLGCGILFSRPSWKFTEIIVSPSLGGKYFRRMVVRIILVLTILGLLRILAAYFAIDAIYSAVVFHLPAILLSFYILWNSAVDLDAIERAHKEELEKRLDYEKLFNLSFDMICIATMDGNFKYVNAAFERTLGFNAAEFYESSFFEFIHPDDRDTTLKMIKELTEGKPSVYMENRYVTKDGSFKVLGWTSSWVKEEGLIFAVARDLTEIKHADEEVRRSYKFVEVILDNVPNMIFVKDAKELRFLTFNKAGENLLGYPRQELIGKNDYNFFPKEEADFFTKKDRMVLAGKETVEVPEEPIHTKYLGERLLRTKKIPVCGSNGSPQYLLGISEDITDMKRLSEERERTEIILKSAERINSLIQNSLDAVVGMNGNGIITSWNSQAEKIFGWNEQEAKGQILANLIIPARFREAHKKGIKKFLSTGEGPILNNRIELAGLRKGEIEFPIELAVTPIQENQDWLFYAFVRDISDRKNFEQQQKDLLEEEHAAREAAERTMNMQDDFLSIAAHELRTPITPITMQLQLIERAITKVTDTQFPAVIKQNLLRLTYNSNKEIDRLARLIDELLDVTRISAGRLILNLEEVNLSEIVKFQIERNQITLKNSGSRLLVNIQEHVVGMWDLTRMESLVENLLTNAIKYGNGKEIEMKLEMNDKTVLLMVKDHGIGISKEDQLRIFSKFERAASVKDYSGLGLGLYITSEIVKAHHGSIKLESSLQEGSNFLVELPLKPNLLS